MSDAGTVIGPSCTQCGAALQGKFCSACGSAAVSEQPSEGWGSLSSEFFSSHGRNGVLSVLLSFLRHPVDTIIRLTDDPTYRSQWGFLTATIGAQMTLTFVLLPRLFSALFHVPNTADGTAVVTNEIVQYVGMAILTPIQYYVCRWLGSRRRSPMSYVKLCVLSVSYGAILTSAVAIFFFALAVGLIRGGVATDFDTLWQGLSLLTVIAILVFVTESHRRFWGMSWPVATVLTICIAALSWLVVYPGLGALVELLGVAGALKGVFGS